MCYRIEVDCYRISTGVETVWDDTISSDVIQWTPTNLNTLGPEGNQIIQISILYKLCVRVTVLSTLILNLHFMCIALDHSQH
jgi:hypothetical protein